MDISSNFKIYFNKIIVANELFTIYKGIDKKANKQIIAKKIDFNKEPNKEFKNIIDKEIKNIRNINLSNNSHHYINHFIEKDNLFIIYENYDDNLENLMNKTKFTIEEIKDIISQLNSIFKLLYDKNIPHLDIKPCNILTKQEKNGISYLLGNYGFYDMQKNHIFNNKNNKDFSYIPPEIKLKLSNDLNLNKADLWSIGILLYNLFFQHLPFKNEEEYLNYISNKNGKLNINTNNNDLNNLIENLLISDVTKRLSWEEYFNHNFFKNSFGRIYYDNYEIEFEGILKNNRKYRGKEFDLYGNLEFEGEYNDKNERWKGKIKEYNENCKLIFEGEYLNGNRIGKEYNDKGELIFEGQYKNGIRWNGKGKEDNNKLIFQGKYKKGIRIGKEYYHNERLKFEGDRNGKGVEYFYASDKNKPLEILFKGEYKNNKRWNGEGKDIYIINGNGKGKEYNIYGSLEFEGEYKDGNKFKGKESAKYYTKIYIDQYKENNIWIGKEYYDYEKGIIQFEGEYKNRQRWKGKEYHQNGKIKFEGEYKDNEKWKGKEYNENEEIYFEGIYQKEYYHTKFWTGCEYKDSKIICTYKNGNKLNNIISIENMKNGIFFNDNNNNTSTGLGKEYIYDELIFEGEYDNNCRIKGKEYENNNLIFEGDYKNNNKWRGKFKSYENEDLILEGEYRYGNKKYYIYIPFYRNQKEYIIGKTKINKYNEIIYYVNNKNDKRYYYHKGYDLQIREIPKYDYNIDNFKLELEKDKLLNSINRYQRNVEIFDYKFNYYIVYDNYESLQDLIDKFKVKLPNDLIYQFIIKMKNIFEFFENNKIFYDLNSENLVYKETRFINIYLDIDLYLFKSNYYYKKPKLIKTNDNKLNYYAPELYDNTKISNLTKVNIWSLGILIYQMIYHEFPDMNYEKNLDINNLLHNLIIKMLSISPENRISLKELNNDELIKQINILNDKDIKADGTIKIIFIGESAVGNNSLNNSFINNIPYLSHIAIIGINYEMKLIYYKGLKIRLQVYNCPGQERFFIINKNFVKNSDIVIFSYDVNDNNTINRLKWRYNSIKETFENTNKIFAICGNKIDLKDNIIDNEEEIMRNFTKENNLDYYCRTSCKTYEGIEDMFINLIDIYLKKNNNTLKNTLKSNLNNKNKNKKKDCNIF